MSKNNNTTTNSSRGPFYPYGGDIDVMRLVRCAFFTPMGGLFTVDGEESWGMPVFFEGPPGSSKTSQFYQFAKRLYSKSEGTTLAKKFESLKPGSRGEGFFGCTPAMTTYKAPDGSEQPAFTFPLPLRFMQKFGSGAGIILLDELPNAQPVVKPALLGFLQERELGEAKFGSRIRIFGAGNAIAESPNAHEFSPPEANRLAHLYWPDPQVSDVTAYFVNGCRSVDDDAPIDLEAEEERVLKQFYNIELPKAAGAVAGWLHRRPETLRRQPNATDPEASRAWASPRSWENAMRALASAACNDLTQAETELYFGAMVGEALAQEFFVWKHAQDLPDPTELLDGRASFTPTMSRLDRTAAVLASCTSVLTGPNAKADRILLQTRARRFWALARPVAEQTPDLLAPTTRALDKAGLIAGFPDAVQVLAKLAPIATGV